jgi:hypothetical protein
MPRTPRGPAPAPDVKPSDEHDSPWKEAIEGAFPEFMAFYFSAAQAAIDWTRAHAFLNQELRKVVRDAASGKSSWTCWCG